MATFWILWGAWSNYLMWDVYPVTYPVSPSFFPASPAPDYAVMVGIPVSLMLLSAVFEMAYREWRKAGSDLSIVEEHPE